LPAPVKPPLLTVAAAGALETGATLQVPRRQSQGGQFAASGSPHKPTFRRLGLLFQPVQRLVFGELPVNPGCALLHHLGVHVGSAHVRPPDRAAITVGVLHHHPRLLAERQIG
jgi:hypothetical protein